MRAGAFAFLGLFALIVSACGGGDVGSTANRPQSPPSASRNQINATPRDKVQDGGKFTWPLDQMPANFNYYELDGTPQDGYYVLAALMPTPYTNNAVGAPVWNSDYLASEPKLTTDPKQIVTYEINPKAVWYDGTPITWEDFFWQWKATSTNRRAPRGRARRK
jgi:peptide/nickel transport system substrate-binding protein